MKSYTLKNLDCADCAVKIEEELKKLNTVDFVSVNFATSSMKIDTEKFDEVVKRIKKVEPDVEVIDEENNKKDNGKEEQAGIKKIISIAVPLAVFVLGLIFEKVLHETPFSIGEYLVFFPVYIFAGRKVLVSAVRNILRGNFFDENFLMTIATVGAVFIHALPEAAGVMLFFTVGEYFEDLALNRSRKSIKALLEIKPEFANLKRGDEYEKVAPEEVSPGDTILVKPGERVPLDGKVISGNSQADTSALTGESAPRLIKSGDTILSGMIPVTGSLVIKVEKSYTDSSIYRILDLVENAIHKKAKTERFITSFARYYTPFIVLLALSIAIIPPLLIEGALFSDWIYRALVILVISCPCALVISIPLGYFGGIGAASKRGILVKGSNYLDTISFVRTVVFDKTGTLTKGNFKVTEVVRRNGFSKEDILKYAALTEFGSNHPIATAIKEAYMEERGISRLKTTGREDYREISGFGIKADIDGRSVIVGNDRLMHREKIPHEDCDIERTVSYVAVDGVYAGYIIISDEVKPESRAAIAELRNYGINNIVMLTGDNEKVAAYTAKSLGIDKYYAELLPEDKVNILEKIMNETRKNEKVAFVGDGINDTPVLARADVGIAMGELGSDAAIDTADIVLMTDNPLKIPKAIRISKRTRKIVWENIALALAVKAFFIVFGAFGLADMWEAVFADVGVALIAILNALRVLR
ncbi:MAG: cadmium-translocating P-type ATPase [Spirochaetes bacterium]|nr:cadmium-translocating P-type ATPase [Spirochaetota bacterium]